jgi:hypothetical protein
VKKKSPQDYTMDIEKIAESMGMTVDEFLADPEPEAKKENAVQFDPSKLKYGPRIGKK